ncbi:MAG: hypothetical protein HOV81_03135 [Kofleriaceae bacterium]|nr:hypothetical protein [Kofleriaceae bacterium]
MRTLRLACLTVAGYLVSAQIGSARADVKETVDIATVTFPDGWTRTSKERTYVLHTTEDVEAGTFCQLYAMVSATSTGGIDGDFDAEWKVYSGNFGLKSATPIKARAIKGWSAKAAKGTLVHNGRTVTVSVYVYSDKSKRLAYITVTNDPKRYAKPISTFLSSIALSTTTTAPSPASDSTTTPPVKPGNGKQTNFSDGWVSVEEPDWVRAVNGDVTVLVHHRTFNLRDFINQDGAKHVWQELVSPRYKDQTAVRVRKNFWSDGDYMNGKDWIEADAKTSDGKAVHVALFKGGNGQRWIEIITPTQAVLHAKITEVLDGDGTNWAPLLALSNLNKFSVAAADLPGQWASSSGASVDYVNVYTGTNAGTAYASSTSTFTFKPDGAYESIWKGASNAQDGRGTVFGQESYKGKYSVKDWEVTLTNRFKGATHTFTAQFEAVAGGRVLHLWRGQAEELHLFKVTNPAK